MFKLLERHREDASKLMYRNSYPTVVIAEVLDTTIEQIESYLGKQRRVYQKSVRRSKMKYHVSKEAIKSDAVRTLWWQGYTHEEIAIALSKPARFVSAIVGTK